MRSTATGAPRRRTLLLAAAFAVLVLGSGTAAVSCSSDGSDGPSGTVTTTTVATGSGEPADPPLDPADQVVWQERSAGGLVPVSVVAAEGPTLTIYADGRIFLADREATSRYDHPVPLRAGQVPEAALKTFLDEVEASGLFAEDVDFGEPEVSDLATTSVSAHVAGATATVEVYALEASFEEDLSAGEVDHRNSLRDLLAAGADLATDAARWEPDRVRVTDLGVVPPEGASTASPDAWPGPPFATFAEVSGGSSERCLVVEGDEAAVVFDAAVANPEIAFTAGDEVHEVVVAALLPGEPGCPA